MNLSDNKQSSQWKPEFTDHIRLCSLRTVTCGVLGGMSNAGVEGVGAGAGAAPFSSLSVPFSSAFTVIEGEGSGLTELSSFIAEAEEAEEADAEEDEEEEDDEAEGGAAAAEEEAEEEEAAAEGLENRSSSKSYI
jgi:hypothetical protein